MKPPGQGAARGRQGLSDSTTGGVVDTRPQWFGHPAQLARLFTTEAMERFGYYGMRALLTLYLANHFLFADSTTTSLYGGFTALVYLTPLVGGLLADNYLGSKKAVKFGAILMALGYFTLCFGGEAARPWAEINGTRYDVTVETSGNDKTQFVAIDGQKLQIKGNEDGTVSLLGPDGSEARRVEKGGFEAGGERDALFVTIMLLGLSAVTIGNGFFKPNISTMVGSLYAKGDSRRDAGFTIFYMGINIGSLGSQLACPFLADKYGWWAGFLLAALGMTLSWFLIQFAGPRLEGYGEPPANAPKRDIPIYLGAIACVPLVWFLFTNLMAAPPPVEGAGFIGYLMGLPILGKVLFGTFLACVVFIPIWSIAYGNRQEWQMMLAAIILIVFNVVFWTLFEQAGSSLTLFAARNTELSVFGLFEISPAQTQFFNAIFIVMLAPLFSLMWQALGRRGLEPGIPVKFGLALAGVGGGFLFLVWGSQFAGDDFKVGLWWLAGLYLIHSMAELMISPVGLSMVTKLSIARVVGLMMGLWFVSIACAQYVGGLVAQVASVETVGGQVTNLKVSLDTYTQVFQTIGLAAAAIGGLLLLISPLLKKLMHGVK
jgi:POT family proton-dependent oligopeptide transporter